MACLSRAPSPWVAVSIAAAFWLGACAKTVEEIRAEPPVKPVNVEANLALKGYDPVAYFSDGTAIAGTRQFTSMWKGATWQFASAGHKALFDTNPQAYAPQYGGYCAYAMSNGAVVDADPTLWGIEKGRLFVNNNVIAHTLWKQDRDDRIMRADQNWPLLRKLDGH
jgi:YHS domain-containing protein